VTAELAYTLWLAHLAAYTSRQQNLAVHWELEMFEERLCRYRRGGV
jgi:hypothetical protein